MEQLWQNQNSPGDILQNKVTRKANEETRLQCLQVAQHKHINSEKPSDSTPSKEQTDPPDSPLPTWALGGNITSACSGQKHATFAMSKYPTTPISETKKEMPCT